ncbi:MAG TPA: hypothetical protein VFY79_13480 [Dehalococcoidia bacterium]|nr:hypothetical protein [Dehalococcoidia bacterium]
MLLFVWGPVSAWAAAIATFIVALVALLASLRVFEALGRPSIRITFEQREPWCREATIRDGTRALWVRVGVENTGRDTAHGCIGRMTSLKTGGVLRADVDPLQLRWAGTPRALGFHAVDLRRDQREFLNVLLRPACRPWHIETFDNTDFDPGFTTELAGEHEHAIEIAVFAHNARTVARSLVVRVGEEDGAIAIHLQ